MNTVLNSYGQLYGYPEILKKSCKFFCRGLDIRVPEIMNSDFLYTTRFAASFHLMIQIIFCYRKNTVVRL